MLPVTNRARGRVVALIALLVLAGVSLHGHLPGHDQARGQQTDNAAATIAVVTLITAASIIVAIAIISTLRRPPPAAPAVQYPVRRRSGERWRPRWRILLIGLGVILAWLLFVVLLARLTGGFGGTPSTAPTTAAPAATPAPTQPPLPAQPPKTESGLFWYLVGITVFMLLVWAAGVGVALRRHRRAPKLQPMIDDVAEPDAEPPAPPSLALAAERGLAEMGDLSREPREAIIACYAAMEDALARAPGAMPQESDTPSEVLARAVEHHAIHTGTATDLVELFAEARFSPHVMHEGHRDVAMRALQTVLAELRSAA
jgi:Domain of unknown function (DUF4129)